jgi:peptidoglycan/LPS O-acetylase OafA/YrhL
MEWVQVLRGFAASMVVFLHLGIWEAKAFGTNLATPQFLSYGDAGVDVFFVISGFIMVFITPRELVGLSDWLAFLYRRFTRIFPPYWIISGVLVLVWFHKPDMFNGYYHNQVDLVRSFFLLPQSFTPLVTVGWSLIHEVYFYVVLSLLFFWGDLGRIRWLAIWSATILLANLLGLAAVTREYPALQLVLSPFSLEFQMGMLVAFSYRKITTLRLPPWLFIALALAGIVGIYFAGYCLPSIGVYPNNNSLFRIGCQGLAAFVVVLSIVQLDAATSIQAPAAAVLLGDASYALYLTHVPIISAAYKIFAHFQPHPGLIGAVGCLLMTIALV